MTVRSAGRPAVAAPFAWAGEHLACDLPTGHVLFMTRGDGAVLPPVPPSCTAQGRQVHGAYVARVRVPPDPEAALAEADGQATALAGVGVSVRTADCLPIALVAPEAVAMVHAGWRGLGAGVIGAGVAALRELGVTGAIHAAMGPAARVCCYEVGEEVHAAFAGDDARFGDHLDLAAIARRQLAQAGVDDVRDCGLCTICTPPDLFFSHRRDGPVTGRQTAVAWRS